MDRLKKLSWSITTASVILGAVVMGALFADDSPAQHDNTQSRIELHFGDGELIPLPKVTTPWPSYFRCGELLEVTPVVRGLEPGSDVPFDVFVKLDCEDGQAISTPTPNAIAP